MDKYIFKSEDNGYDITIEQVFEEGATVEELVEMFKGFLLANRYAEESIDKYIDEYGEITYETNDD